jgi:formylglycine-generating enzyme required for sulfatase activity/serine/threonine protein kinase
MLKIDRYDVIDQLGRGRLGNVYRALHPDFQKYVVIKEIISDLAGNEGVKTRFEQEIARLMQIPTHANVVAVRDGLVLNNRLYLVMDYVDGGSLSGVMESGVWAPQHVAGLLMQLLSGLEIIHARGLIHNNLKPNNILLNTEGTAMVSDISITEKVFGRGESKGVFNPKYAAPELIESSLGRSGTPEQIDIYAVGMLAYEMLLGGEDFRRAFPDIYNGKAGDELKRWLNWHTGLARGVRNLSQLNTNIPNPLANTVERMMAKDVNNRYKNTGEVKRDLAAWLHPSDVRRRADKPDDDATVPMQHIRGGGAKPNQPGSSNAPQYPQYPAQQYPQQNYGNAPNQGYYQQPNQPQPPAQPPQGNWQMQPQPPGAPPVPPTENKKGLPFWLLMSAGGLFGIIVIAIVLFLLHKNPGLTLIVTGAPPGSDVYIKDARGEIRRGVPVEGGNFRVAYLLPGLHNIQVRCNGYADFATSIDGQHGEEKIVPVVMSKGECTLPKEITYKGHVMVLVCAGEFNMGSNTGEPDEKPEHKITLPDYYIDKYEVSNQRYKEFCDGASYPTPTPFQFYKDLFEKNPTFPVIGISWMDAKKYAEWRGLRLPTEEEWEKAASWDPQTKTKRLYPWGAGADPTRGKFASKSLATVDGFSNGVSAYGAFNMAGNAAEWVESGYKPYPGSPSSEGFDESKKIARGGSVADPIEKSRASYRAPHPADDIPNAERQYYTAIGFRCAILASDPNVQAVIRTMTNR